MVAKLEGPPFTEKTADAVTPSSGWSFFRWFSWTYEKPIGNKVSISGTTINAIKIRSVYQKVHNTKSSLNLSGCLHAPFQEIAKYTHHLSELDLSFSKLPPQELLDALPALKNNNPNLKSINFSFATIDFDTLTKILEAFPSLKEVYIDSVTGLFGKSSLDLLPWIKNNSCLKNIHPLTVTCIEDLEQLIQALPATLESLSLYLLSPSNIIEKGLPLLSEKFNLKNLTVYDRNENKDFISLSQFSKLPEQFPLVERLSLSALSYTSKEIKQTLELFELKTLDLSPFENLKTEDIVALIKLNKDRLEEFYVNNSPSSENIEIAKALAKCPKLVNLNFCPFTDENLENEALCPALACLKPILGNLETFNFDWSPCNLSDFDFIGKHFGGAALKEIDLGITSTKWLNSLGACIKDIADRSPHVISLNLGIGEFDTQLPQLKQIFSTFHYLQNVGIFFTHVESDLKIEAFQALIQNNPDLTSIGTTLSHAEMAKLAKLCPEVGKSVFINGLSDYK